MALAAAGLAGCGGGDSDEGSAGSGKAPVTLVTFGGEIDAAITAAYADPVTKASGQKVRLDSPTDYAKLQTQVETGNVSWDVVAADPWWTNTQCGTLVQKLQFDRSTIDPKLLSNDCQVPAELFTYNVLYNTDEHSTAPRGWADFFDTKRFPGKRGVWGSYAMNGMLEGALLADGVAEADLYPLDVDRALRKLDTIKGDIVFYDTLAQGAEQLASGNVSMSVNVASTGYLSARGGGKVAPAWDQALLGFVGYVVPKGVDMAKVQPLLDRIASPEGQKAIAKISPIGIATKDAVPVYDELQKTWGVSTPENEKQQVPMDMDYWGKNYDDLSQRWTAWVGG